MEFPGEDFVIYAGQLREMGGELPDNIPDCAWVPKSSVSWGKPSFKEADSPDRLEMDIDIHISEPWRWASIDITIPPEILPKKDA